MKKTSSLFAGLPQEVLDKRKKVAQPSFIPPMLATLTKNYFSKNDWIYEHKFDGVRCLAFKKNGVVTLLSRNDRKMNIEYPELAQALEQQSADNFIIDGEIIAESEGVSDFELLQGRINLRSEQHIKLKEQEVPIFYRIFDLVYVDGYDVRPLPLSARKSILKKLLRFNKILTYTEHKVGQGITLFKKACKLGWEGLIAKKFDSPYVGVRSPNWLKFKCFMQQELVIGGYTMPQGSRKYFGALLVGYYDKHKKLQFAGKVGTGYSAATLELLGKKMKRLKAVRCPFSNYDGTERNIQWVRPVLVAEFEFAEWTRGGKLRVGRYKGLRTDKSAKLVVQEVPKAIGLV